MTRQCVISKARSLVGRTDSGRPMVKFRHQGRDPKSGLDCAGVVVWVAHELGYRENFDFTAYERYPNSRQLRMMLDANMHRKLKGDALPGDVLLLRDVCTRWPLHLGLLTDFRGDRGILHSWVKVRGVVETAIPKAWKFRVAGIYCYRPLAEVGWDV